MPEGWPWEDVDEPKPYPPEFRDDVARVARRRDPGAILEQIAADFGIHPMTLSKWLRKAAIDDGSKSGTTSAESNELRAARRRIRSLEQGNEALRRAATPRLRRRLHAFLRRMSRHLPPRC